ncbi:hypothetical protein LCGC14_0140480 [marine sediment metagenome]|uniref:Uncharacterized protein n=1 Tax=marine sediment metagenome TaxID=412755 RepID=A0A0F9VG64_9ZZZZ
MSQTAQTTGTSTGFGSTEFKANAAVYAQNAAIMNAASKYDSLDDAQAALKLTWETYERQIEEGTKSRYTPPRDLGFGSDSAAVIAESILGRRNGIGATRMALKKLGK